MRRIIYGFCTIISLIMSIAALVAFGVLYVLVNKLQLHSQLRLSFYSLCCFLVLSIFFLVLFIKQCRKVKKRVTFKGLTTDLTQELNAIVLRHKLYVEDDKNNTTSEVDIQVRVENLADMINKGGESDENGDTL